MRALHGMADEFLQEVLDRLFAGDLQQQLDRDIRIEPAITHGFHNSSRLPDDGRFVHLLMDEISVVYFFALPINGRICSM